MLVAPQGMEITEPAISWQHSASGPLPIRIVSHNIRYAASSRFKNEEDWSIRGPLLVKQLKHLSRSSPNVATFFCLQEVLDRQLQDIMRGLNGNSKNSYKPDFHRVDGKAAKDKGRRDDMGRTEWDERTDGVLLDDEMYDDDEWAYIGVARDDGVHRGEYEPVIYRRKDWRCVFWRTTWLSATNAVPSRGWDAANTRILTQGIFVPADSPTYYNTTVPYSNALAPPTMRGRGSGREIAVMATHLDHIGKIARQKSAELIIRIMERYEGGYAAYTPFNVPIAMGGDFNSPPDDGAYKTMAAHPEVSIDIRAELERQGREDDLFGEHYTYTSFGGEAHQDLIDFVWIGPNNKNAKDKGVYTNMNPWEVQGYAVIPSWFSDVKKHGRSVIVSDHRAVVADLILH